MTEISTDQWRKRGQILPLNGHRIFVIDEGTVEKPVILLIHGFPTASWDWHKIWDKLGEHYRLVALDMLGFGFSDKPSGYRYSIMEQANIVEALVRAKHLENFHVLAHDYGDTVAQELLARQNSATGAGNWLSLTLLNGGLFPETHHPVFAQKLLLSPLGPLVTRLIGKRKFADNLRAVFGPETPPSHQDIEGFWHLININRGKRNFHRLIGYMPDRIKHRERWVNALQQSRFPIALINGSQDPVSGAHMVDRYLELIGHVDHLVRLDQIGHYPQVEAPESVSKHILDFLSKVTA